MNNLELNELKRNRTIPIFDCLYELDEHLAFYTALGFDITYYQKAPYRFATVKNEFTEISFYGNKKLELDGNGGGCYIVVPDVEKVYNQLKTNLKSYYGKIPVRGLPRFSRLNLTTEDRRFNVSDPSGNTLIIGEPLGDSSVLMERDEVKTKVASKFEKAYKWAYKYAYSKEDFLAASNLIESTFHKKSEHISNELYFKAKVLQIDVLIILDREEKAKEIVQELDSSTLTSEEKINVQDEIQRFLELKEQLL